MSGHLPVGNRRKKAAVLNAFDLRKVEPHDVPGWTVPDVARSGALFRYALSCDRLDSDKTMLIHVSNGSGKSFAEAPALQAGGSRLSNMGRAS